MDRGTKRGVSCSRLCHDFFDATDVFAPVGHEEGEDQNATEDDMSQRDTLDQILSTGQPPVSDRSPALDAAITRTSREAQRQARPRRRMSRSAAAGLAALLAVGGGATAAVAATWQWHPWAMNPDATFTVTLPSGATCEYRAGAVSGASAETTEAVRAFIAANDIVEMADVDGAIAEARADGQTMYDDNGELRPAGPGTELYNADFEYQSALNLAVSELVSDHLRARGILTPYSLDMQADCGDE